MNPVIQPYLFFGGRCEEAIAFYEKTIGAKVIMLMRYKEAPEQPPEGTLAPGYADKIMHAAFQVGDTVVMASDGCGPEGAKFVGFVLSLTMPTEAEAQRAYTALADGGSIAMPLGPTFWSPCFGMVTDKFGLGWMVTVPEVKP
jgi:PhnB protein